MKTRYDSYNEWVGLFVTTFETLLAGVLFFFLMSGSRILHGIKP